MKQYTLQMRPVPLPPPPEDNVFYYGETYTEVEEFEDEHGSWVERATAKEIITRKFYCEYAEFNSQGYCIGGCTSEHDKAYCMDLQKLNRKTET